MPAIDGFIFAWNKNKDYGANLVADLTEEQMILQPAPADKAAANHPAWVLSHLNVYLPVIQSIISGDAFEDPKDHQFGMLSKPSTDRGEYQSKDELVQEFVSRHESIADMLQQAGDAALAKKVSLPRWEAVMPTAAIALPYLMLSHENGHLGQLSAWRRIQGLPSV